MQEQKYQYIDTHAHININAFKDDWQAVATKCAEEGIAVLNVGTQQDTSRQAVTIADEADNCYAVIGLHPIHTSASYHDEKELGGDMKGFTSRGEVFDRDYYRTLAQNKKVVAIGECGLDYYRLEGDTRQRQEEAFIAQIELANELGLPLMIHTRDANGNQASAAATGRSAYDDVYDLVKRYAKVRGNLHFYAGNWQQAKKFWELGFTTSFTGVITFSTDYAEVVKNAPLDMIHAETDCPYVAPIPYRGQRCEPWMIKEVYKKIAELRRENEEIVREQLVANANCLYPTLLES